MKSNFGCNDVAVDKRGVLFWLFLLNHWTRAMFYFFLGDKSPDRPAGHFDINPNDMQKDTNWESPQSPSIPQLFKSSKTSYPTRFPSQGLVSARAYHPPTTSRCLAMQALVWYWTENNS